MAKKRKQTRQAPQMARDKTWRVMEAARILDEALQDDLDSMCEIAEERRRVYLNRLRDALECEDQRGVFFYARRLCGVPEPPQQHPPAFTSPR